MIATSSSILGFYRGEPDYKGRTLEDILAQDDRQTERDHDFIQVLFPLREASIFNHRAPILDEKTIATFRRSSKLKANLLRAFDHMLAFYGFWRGTDGQVYKSRNFKQQAANWLTPGNHNFRRISRILQCLTLLGLPNQAKWFYIALIRVYDRNKRVIGYERACKWYEALQLGKYKHS